ncbi:MAG TPA: SpoIIE family protein phosphatase [Verrucomicrobiae bacterium]|nr:SpoIIE family protein phosphatase [Verrucomicrobiae bacterium]
MESESLKILLIGGDEQSARTVAGMLGGHHELVTVPAMDAAFATLAGNHSFHAVLFDLPAADKDGLLQVGLFSVKKPRLPIIVLGPVDDESFATEIIRAGAQDYLAANQFDAHLLIHTLHCAIERQNERSALIEEKDNYYGVFDHLVEGIFRTTPDGHYLLANIALANIYGYASPVELMANITDIAHRLYVEPGRREEFIQLMQANDTITGFESRIYRADETIIWIAENCRAVRDQQGNLMYYEGTVEDITERKHSEDQIRRTTAELSRSREELRSKNQLMEDNLRMAREIQTAMLPQQYPVFPNHVAPDQSALQFTHRYQPAEAVSGDFFSVSALSDNEVGVFICDVAGHGVRAALVTAMIRALAEELKPFAREPGKFLQKLNSDLFAILKSTGSPMLTTAFYFVADWQTGLVRFANAGHPKPLLVRKGSKRVEPLANDCGRGQPALGLFDAPPPYQTTETTMMPGDFLMLFTDGLYEVQGANEELYSQQRLMIDVQHLIGQPAGELFDHLLETIRTFATDREFEDDVCLVGMEFKGQPAGQ